MLIRYGTLTVLQLYSSSACVCELVRP